jgi:hypothetical protein
MSRKLHIRRVTETITYIETVMVAPGKSARYIEQDGIKHDRYRVTEPAVAVVEDWREATEVETILQGQTPYRTGE